MLFKDFALKHRVKTQGKLDQGINKPTEFNLPVYSAIHYLPTTDTEFGIDVGHSILLRNDRPIYVDHRTELEVEMGQVTPVPGDTSKLVKQYHKRYIRTKRLRKLDPVLRDRNNILVVNYAAIKQLYRYRKTAMSVYEESYNLLKTALREMTQYVSNNDWQHWIPLELAEHLPEVERIKLAASKFTRDLVADFHEVSDLVILELWKFIGNEPSLFDEIGRDLEPEVRELILDKINLVWFESGSWLWLSLGDLYRWRQSDVNTLRKNFIAGLTELYEARTTMSTDAIDFVDDEVVVSEEALTKHILDRSSELMAAGKMSTAEYNRMAKLSVKYKTIPSPDGNGTLEDHLKITEDDLSIDNEPIPEIDGVLDKSMLKSSLSSFDSKYIKVGMSKDIANMVMTLQRANIAVVGYDVKETVDVANKFRTYTIKVQPADGATSTIKFDIPIVEENGVYVANGVNYRMAKQPGDLPISKVKPDRVALTSYYGKAFVSRSERTVHNYGSWLAKNIIAVATDKTSDFSDLHYGDTSDSSIKVPRAYSGISKRVSSFNYLDYHLSFDFKSRERIFGEDKIAKAEKSNRIVIGKDRKTGNLLTLDFDGTVEGFDIKKNRYEPKGSIESFLNLSGKVPVEMAEVGIFSKTIPVGFILGYFHGFDKLLKGLKVKHRFVPRGTRVDMTADEYSIVFKDETLVLPRTDRYSAMILSGFNMYKKQVSGYNSHNFNSKDVYRTILNSVGLKASRFIKEIDLMFDMFIDHITYEQLVLMQEPTTLDGLFRRACEMLVTDEHPKEGDPDFIRYRGYERMTGMVYSELIRSVRTYRGNPAGTGAKVSMNPRAVWMAINKDASVGLVEQSNPVHNLKEIEQVTHAGAGGRNARSMTREARLYHPKSIGTISEATVDSAKVAVNVSLSSDPNLTNLRGNTKRWDKAQGTTSVMSTSANLAPSADRDDPKRINFISIQQSAGVGCDNYRPLPMTTGYENVLAHRVDDLFAFTAKDKGKIKSVTDTAVTIVYSDKEKTETVIEIGTRMGLVTGTYYPHNVVCDLKAGSSFDKGDVICFNTGFFERAFFDPRQVQWKSGILVNTVLMESADTLEDSSSIRNTVSDLLSVDVTTMDTISVDFDQVINDMVKQGDKVTPDDVLGSITDYVLGDAGKFDEGALEVLDSLSAVTSKPSTGGTVDKIEVVYNGELEDMNESLRKLVSKYERERAAKVKELKNNDAVTGKVTTPIRIGGVPLKSNSVIFKVFITKRYTSGTGDKAVFANALKTVFGSVFSGVLETESGIQIDAKFAYQSISNRIVLSPEISGTANTLLIVMSKHVANLY